MFKQFMSKIGGALLSYWSQTTWFVAGVVVGFFLLDGIIVKLGFGDDEFKDVEVQEPAEEATLTEILYPVDKI